MSLGGGGESQVMKDAIEYAYRKGVVIIAAAGNENNNSASYPARYARVIGVGATDAQGERAEFSNYGAGVDIAAPGGGHGSKIWQETIDPETNLPQLLAASKAPAWQLPTSQVSPRSSNLQVLLNHQKYSPFSNSLSAKSSKIPKTFTELDI